MSTYRIQLEPVFVSLAWYLCICTVSESIGLGSTSSSSGPTNDAPAGFSRIRTLGRRATESDFLTTNDTTSEPQLPRLITATKSLDHLALPLATAPIRLTSQQTPQHPTIATSALLAEFRYPSTRSIPLRRLAQIPFTSARTRLLPIATTSRSPEYSRRAHTGRLGWLATPVHRQPDELRRNSLRDDLA